jgi:hypothetical protein
VDVSNEVQESAAQQAFKGVAPWLAKATCLVVGPGLGKDPVMCRTAYLVVQAARNMVRSELCEAN